MLDDMWQPQPTAAIGSVCGHHIVAVRAYFHETQYYRRLEPGASTRGREHPSRAPHEGAASRDRWFFLSPTIVEIVEGWESYHTHRTCIKLRAKHSNELN